MPCSDKREIKNEIRGDFAAVDFCEELCYHSLPKKQSEEGEIRREKKLCSKAAVQYTFCGEKASVKVRTGSEKMWYNIFAEKNGKTERMQKDSGKFYY